MKKVLIIITIFALGLTSFALKKSGEVKIDKNQSEVFTLINSNGKIEVNGWDKDYILVEYVKIINGFLASSKDIVFEIQEGRTITFKTVYKKGTNNKKVNFVVSIPKDYELIELDTSNGNIEINSLNGDINAETSNGNITANNIKGVVNLSTSNGKIKAKNIAILEKMSSSNGDIEASINDIAESGAKVSTSNGDIILSIPPKLSSNLEVRDANSKITINNDNEKILSASTSNGHVEVNIKTKK